MNDNPDASIEREREIFLAALEKTSPSERKVFLDRACGNDAALRARVESLLRHHSEDSFLEEPAMGAENRPSPESIVCECVGTVIGRYKLLQKIGEGGMGVVYMAEQEEPVRRKVALKIIKLGMDTKQVVARFEAERQALALMDHPNIAKVLDGGATDTGRPYFVMELVQGVPITEFCDKNRLSAEERIKLVHSRLPGHSKRAPEGHHPSRPQAHQHPGDAERRCAAPDGDRFRRGQSHQPEADREDPFHQLRHDDWHARLHEPGAGGNESSGCGYAHDIYGLGVLLYELLTGTTPFPEKRLRSVGYQRDAADHHGRGTRTAFHAPAPVNTLCRRHSPLSTLRSLLTSTGS